MSEYQALKVYMMLGGKAPVVTPLARTTPTEKVEKAMLRQQGVTAAT